MNYDDKTAEVFSIDGSYIKTSRLLYDDDLDDTLPSIQLIVNDVTEWTRTRDFYDDLITTEEGNDVYMFIYDRYRRNKILFNSARNVPELEDTIDITTLDSLGEDGNISADSDTDEWSINDSQFIYNQTTAAYLNNGSITLSLSAATVGGAAAETITEIKSNSQSALRAQFRNVTKNDYNSHLSSRSDVIRATAWGEQDVAPSGSIQKYKDFSSAVHYFRNNQMEGLKHIFNNFGKTYYFQHLLYSLRQRER